MPATYHEIRSKFLAYYHARGHTIIPSASLVPQNDPTTLFTGSGMQPLVPYLLGEPHPSGTRLVDSQKSFRAADIEEVGDNRHTTFFEMLGNWSLGDYFKREQLPWFYGFLIDEVGLDPARLYATVFDGDPAIGVPRDEESIAVLQKIFSDAGVSHGFQAIGAEQNGSAVGMELGARIFSYEAKKNWWSRSGVPANMPEGEPGGPDSEVFYDFDPSGARHDPKWGTHCHPNCDCGRFMEIGNSVFMEYVKRSGAFEKLSQKNVDFGGGLERIVAAKNGDPDVFAHGVLATIVKGLEMRSEKRYADVVYQPSFRVIADHLRAAIFLIADGVHPSNTDQGYFVRRLLRRAVRHADLLGVPAGHLSLIVPVVVSEYEAQYPELRSSAEHIGHAVEKEEGQFRKTLANGIARLRDVTATLPEGAQISGAIAFELLTTFGFPYELTHEELTKTSPHFNLSSMREEFDALMEKHRDLSRTGAEKRFKGGLADTSEETTRLHTAHHLLLKALQTVLGPHVKQRGSNITAERLRIDFSHPEKMTEAQKREAEKIVNEMIHAALPVTRSLIPKSEAETLGAEMEFGAKYPEMVSVYAIGPREATAEDPLLSRAFSLEFCGGPHVQNTNELAKSGRFMIQKEEASSAGVRRIKAVLAP